MGNNCQFISLQADIDINVYLQAEIDSMSDSGGRGPVKAAQLPAQHDQQNPAPELAQTTHISGPVR